MKQKLYHYLLNNKIFIAKDIYDYGYSYLKQYLIYFAIVIPISIYFNIFFSTICFLCLYFPLRSYMGGYHFDNNLMCLLFSIIITILCPLLSKLIEIKFSYYLISIIIAFIFIIVCVPVDHKNKRLNTNEKNIYKLKVIIIEFIYLILSLFLYNYNYTITTLFLINIINISSVILGNHFNKKSIK